MGMRFPSALLVALPLVSLAAGCIAVSPHTRMAAPYDDATTLRAIEGPVGVEDLVRLGTSRWLVGGGLNLGKPAHFYAIDAEGAVARPLDFSVEPAADASCPESIDRSSISLNGMAIRLDGKQEATLYAANHGGRDAVEVFRVTWSDSGPPRLAWHGCIPLPHGDANAIAALRDGAIVVSLFPPLADAAAWARMERGDTAGEVFVARPGEPLRRLDVGAVSGPNGLYARPGGDTLFVSDWAGRKLVAIDLATGARRAIPLSFMPDNIHPAPRGRLLLAGQDAHPSAIAACTGAACPQPWVVALVDPASGAVREILRRRGDATVSYAASAVAWAKRLFITVRGDDRILVTRMPDASTKW